MFSSLECEAQSPSTSLSIGLMSAGYEVGAGITAARFPTSTTDAHTSVKLSGSPPIAVQKPFLTFVETLSRSVSPSSTLHTLSDQTRLGRRNAFMATVGGSAGPLLKMSEYTSGLVPYRCICHFSPADDLAAIEQQHY